MFLFLKGQDQKPWADEGMVGEVFAQAKFRIVLDSANARGSPGLLLKVSAARCCYFPCLPQHPLCLLCKESFETKTTSRQRSDGSWTGQRPPPAETDELLSLRQDYERTARVVSVLFDDAKEIRKEIFHLMHEAADRGMRGSAFSVEDGRANLTEVQETILDYAHSVRSKRLKEYTAFMVLFGVIPLILGAVVLLTGAFGWLNRPAPGQAYDPLFAWILAAFWIPAGAAICVWGEFALRMQAGLSYDQLLNLDPSRWRPGQRLLITVGISFIFAFLLAFDAVQVGLGSLLLNEFANKTPAMALAVGGITGLAFAAVQDIIFRVRPTLK